MKLWTVQPIEWYEELLKCGTIYGSENYVDKDFLLAYRWLMRKMIEKIGNPKFSGCYPIWAWYQYNGSKRRKPDLRISGFLPKGTKGVRIEIDKEESEVLMSDFDLWHHPLNFGGINDTEEDCKEFDRLLEQSNSKFLDRENYPEEIKQKLAKS